MYCLVLWFKVLCSIISIRQYRYNKIILYSIFVAWFPKRQWIKTSVIILPTACKCSRVMPSSSWESLQSGVERCHLTLRAECPPATGRFLSPDSGRDALPRKVFHSLPLSLSARDLITACEIDSQIPEETSTAGQWTHAGLRLHFLECPWPTQVPRDPWPPKWLLTCPLRRSCLPRRSTVSWQREAPVGSSPGPRRPLLFF